MNDTAYLSIGSYIQTFVDWLNVNYSMPFEVLSTVMEKSVKVLEGILLYPHAFVVMAVFSIVAWLLAGKKVGGITFGGLGSVAPDFAGWGKTLWSAGAGFRWVIAPKNDISLRVDIARGRDETIYYVGIGEAF